MNRTLKTGATALMLAAMAGNICATSAEAAACANPQDMHAVKAAAVQQRLMVAAFTCNATHLYNRFVTTYQSELQASDRQLQDFFHRLYGQSGTGNYHAFKTRLANLSSMDSIHDSLGYCASTQAAFDAALNSEPKSLAVFLSGQTTTAEKDFAPCEIVTASTRRAPRAQ